jgi:hypothetical protein
VVTSFAVGGLFPWDGKNIAGLASTASVLSVAVKVKVVVPVKVPFDQS